MYLWKVDVYNLLGAFMYIILKIILWIITV